MLWLLTPRWINTHKPLMDGPNKTLQLNIFNIKAALNFGILRI